MAVLNSFKFLLLLITISIFWSCLETENRMKEQEFQKLMGDLAAAWSSQNTDLALSCFTPTATYMEPPNIQYFTGHTQLGPYFDELTEQHQMKFHHLWFDTKTQMGIGEFTFSYGTETADIGIAVVKIKDKKIDLWREYLQKGPSDFTEFISTENKKWEWHIGNYPIPKDSILGISEKKDSLFN